MSALTMAMCIWAMVAFCVVLFVHGASLKGRPKGRRIRRDEGSDFSVPART